MAASIERNSYWRDVGTIDSYYQANIELTGAEPALDLYDPRWPIWTYQAQLPPAKFIGAGVPDTHSISGSMVSGGCVIDSSQLTRALLFSNVKVASGCVLTGALVLPNCIIGSDCRLSKVILDNGCEVPAGTVIGEDPADDAQRYHRTSDGIVVANRRMFGQDREYRPTVTMR